MILILHVLSSPYETCLILSVTKRTACVVDICQKLSAVFRVKAWSTWTCLDLVTLQQVALPHPQIPAAGSEDERIRSGR